MKFGVLDWGIGGIELVQRIREHNLGDVLYLSDSGYVPYGRVPRKDLHDRIRQCVSYLNTKCDHIIIACNAASSVYSAEMNIGSVSRTILSEFGNEKLAVIGGERTISSSMYKSPKPKDCIYISGQDLSWHIENNSLHSEKGTKILHSISDKLKNRTHAVLACTHYPSALKELQSINEQVTFINPLDFFMLTLIDTFSTQENCSVQWRTTGNSNLMQNAARNAFNEQIEEVIEISI